MAHEIVDYGLWRMSVTRCVGGVMLKTWHRRQFVYGVCEWVPRVLWNSWDVASREAYIMGFFDRERKREEGGGGGGNLVDEAFAKKHSTVLEVLAARAVIEGSETNRVSLSLFVQDGQWKAILKDKQDALCLWVTAPTMATLWSSMEACLLDPETVWRKDRYAGAKTAARTKKK